MMNMNFTSESLAISLPEIKPTNRTVASVNAQTIISGHGVSVVGIYKYLLLMPSKYFSASDSLSSSGSEGISYIEGVLAITMSM